MRKLKEIKKIKKKIKQGKKHNETKYFYKKFMNEISILFIFIKYYKKFRIF